MKTLPAEVKPHKRTPEFTEDTIPSGLLNGHATKTGVWGVIHVIEGSLEYHILEPVEELHTLTQNTLGIVEPAVRHQVRPLGPVRFYVEFHSE